MGHEGLLRHNMMYMGEDHQHILMLLNLIKAQIKFDYDVSKSAKKRQVLVTHLEPMHLRTRIHKIHFKQY